MEEKQLKSDLLNNWTLIGIEKYYSNSNLCDFIVSKKIDSVSLIPNLFFNVKWVDLILKNESFFLIKYVPEKHQDFNFQLRAINSFKNNIFDVYDLIKNKNPKISKIIFRTSEIGLSYQFLNLSQLNYKNISLLLKKNIPFNYSEANISIKNKKIFNLLIKKGTWGCFQFSSFYKQYKDVFTEEDLLRIIRMSSEPLKLIKLIDFNVDLALKTLKMNKNFYQSINLCQNCTSYEESVSYLSSKKEILSLIS